MQFVIASFFGALVLTDISLLDGTISSGSSVAMTFHPLVGLKCLSTVFLFLITITDLMRADVVFNKGQWNTDQAIPWDFFHGERFFLILAPSFCLKHLKKSIPG